MGQKYLLDTNVIIDFTANLLPLKAKQKISNIIDEEFIISVVNKIELLGYNDMSDKMKHLETFLDLSLVMPLDETVSDKTIQLRRINKKLKLGDAIIAATSLASTLFLSPATQRILLI